MRLYGSDTSPYVRKARVLIQEKGIDCEWVLERPADPGGRFRELNPLGKIPVLERDDGEVLFDSPVIVEYLDTLSGDRLIPAEGEARWQVQKIHAMADGMLDATVARFIEGLRPEDKRMQEVMDKHAKKIRDSMAYAETLVTNRACVIGDRLSMADLALAVALEYVDFRYAHDWRSNHPLLAGWLAPLSQRSSFVSTQPPKG
jgi:glutathione S-transferase